LLSQSDLSSADVSAADRYVEKRYCPFGKYATLLTLKTLLFPFVGVIDEF
jgi:hypothetical protein